MTALRTVIVGSGGRLGKALARVFSAAGHSVTGFDRAALDLASKTAIAAALEPLAFDLLINAAAATNVDRCETDPAEAYAVNAAAPAFLARAARAKGARMIHISTDYVFDGETRRPLTEEDSPRPLSVYGRSKLAGEEEVLAVSPSFLNVRVSWVFGPERPSFLDWVIDQARVNPSVSAIGDKFSAPSYTADLAAWLLRLATMDQPPGGVLHLCNSGSCSWLEYGQFAIDTLAAAGETFACPRIAFQSLASMDKFTARRPVHTTLSTARFEALTGIRPRPWQEAVREFVLAHKRATHAPPAR